MKILLEQNFKSEFDLSNEEYVFGHEDGQQEIISPYRLLVDFNNPELSSQLQHGRIVDFIWCFISKTFSRSLIRECNLNCVS